MAINIHKLKYRVLEDIIPEFPSKFNTMNIVIDLNSLIRRLFAPNNPVVITAPQHEVSLAASIINLVAHYREYFFRKELFTKFYLIYNYDVPKNSEEYYKNYGHSYYRKISGKSPTTSDIANYVTRNISLAQDVLRYVNDANIINMNEVDQCVIAKYLLDNKAEDNHINMIMSTDDLWFQLLNIPKTMVLYPKRDDSMIFLKGGIGGIAKSLARFKLNENATSLYHCVKGIKTRGIPGMDDANEILKEISRVGYNRITLNIDMFLDSTNLGGDIKDEISKRFKAIDAFYQEAKISIIQADKIEKQLIDKYSYNKLREFNNTIFKHPDNVLYLEELVKGDGGVLNERYRIDWKV